MRFWIVKDGKLVEYERLGECQRCGGCCCTFLITCKIAAFASKDSISDHDWSDDEGFSVFYSQGLIWYMEFRVEEAEERVCKSLEKDICTSWMKDEFPATCRYWPVHPDNLEHFPDCGFNFREV